MHVHGSLSPVPCYSWACAVVWWARAGVSWPLWARLLSGPAADAVLLPSCRGEHKALEPKDNFLGGNRQIFSILFSPQIIPVPQILHKRCLKSTLKYNFANYTNVSDGLKRVIQSGHWLYLPSAFEGLKPGSLRPVRFGNTFMISMAIDGEYCCHCAVCGFHGACILI